MQNQEEEIVGASQRRKGHAFECKMANLFKTIYPDAKRGLQQSRDGCEVADVDCTPFWVECKHGIRPNIIAAYRQAMAAKDDRPALVVTRANGQPIMATMELGHLLTLLKLLDDRMDRWPFWEQE